MGPLCSARGVANCSIIPGSIIFSTMKNSKIVFNFMFRNNPEEVRNPRGGIISNLQLLQNFPPEMEARVLVATQKEGLLFIQGRPDIAVQTVGALSRKGPSWLLKRQLLRDLRAVGCDGPNHVFVGSKGTICHAYAAAMGLGARLAIITRDYNELGIDNAVGKTITGRDYVRAMVLNREWWHAYHAATLVIANSEHLLNKLRGKFEIEKSLVIYPAIDVPLRYLEIRKVRIAGMVGGRKEKGTELIVSIAEKLPEIEFRIYNEHREFKKVPGNVTFLKYTLTREMFEEVDCWLVPSQWEEPFGRIAVEALLYGLPTLVSDIGGLKEAVSSAMLRLPPADCFEWISAITNLQKSPDNLSGEMEKARVDAWNKTSQAAHRNKVHQILDFFD